MTNTKKAAPIWSRLSEQLTRCALCVCDPKHKHGDDSRYQAGGQCNQSGSVRCHTCNERFSLYSLRNCSRAKAHGANLSDSCSIFLRRLFRAGDNVLVNSLSVIVLSCIAMRRNTSHHGADSFYPLGSMPRCCNSLRRTRLIQVAKDVSPSALAASSSCALKSSGNRIWYGGERFSNGVDMVITLHYYTYMVITIVLAITQKSTPRSAGNTYGASNQQRKLGAVMVAVNHIPHLVHTQTAFVWRFLALNIGEKNQLIASVENSYDSRAPHKTGAGIGVLGKTEAHNTRPACFFVPHSHTLSMVGCTGAEQSAPVSSVSGYANPVQSATSEIGVSGGGYLNHTEEAANMATIPTLVHSQTAFLWRFIIFGASEHQIIHVTAWTEREARSRCPSGCVAVFAARIRQEVCHVQ
ncbi:ash family protein [Escherichia coli 3-475-03_S3_C2]|nr:icd-like protein [Escherichia coli EPECa14]EHW19577.1 hypothetical protein ECDEC8C_2299 [Escherichia coli DEC8C]EHW62239.1 hypothetical protein ECDEC10A_3074 [Escherichia coli DEC10A]EII32531.1 Ash family protein [Escherichia coli 4.0967]EIJ13509.1 Ash family protein [Escherichia coli 900105 (10e)]EKI37907.1 icd-like protein [Escherichia coli 07798]EKJ14822.1 icd-like protein [Escherichia coli EC1865]KDZ47357.1 ash family protein [Escherichia coli 3-073-06_S1_C1]KEK89648.1 ash family pro